MAKKQSKGRQRVEMVKMKNDSNLQVTFSKRRAGLFKKASELCTLCGAEIAIIVFSPGRKVFSFGHPEVEAVTDRYLNMPDPRQTSGTMQLIEAHRNANIRELNIQLTQVANRLDSAKKRGEELNQMRKAIQSHCWWAFPFEELSLPQLQKLKTVMEELKKNVASQGNHLLMQRMNTQQFLMGSSSSGEIPYETKNNIVFDANMMPAAYSAPDMMPEGFSAPNMMPPPPGFNHHPEGYNYPNPLGYNPGFGRGFF
ncbi:hypothetical protein SCA6_005898 [Theobroma cacao]